MDSWSSLFKLRKKTLLVGLLFVLSLIALRLFSVFLIWNETRSGYPYTDPILDSFSPIDLSMPIAIMTNVPIFGALALLLRRPSTAVMVFWTVIIMCIVRSATLYFVVLEPPQRLILLDDSFLINVFYGGTSLKRDLFFSGHTANVMMVSLLQTNKTARYLLLACAAAMGVMVILQHVHYVIDVIAAPFFALLVFKMSQRAAQFFPALEHISA